MPKYRITLDLDMDIAGGVPNLNAGTSEKTRILKLLYDVLQKTPLNAGPLISYKNVTVNMNNQHVVRLRTEKVCLMTDWDLCIATCHFNSKITNLSEHQRLYLYRTVVQRSDGYGAGVVPQGGYDWSAVRDSSKEAIHIMAMVIRNYLKNLRLEEIEIQTTLL